MPFITFPLTEDNPNKKEFTTSELGLSYISPEEMET